ncbi:hypothetical protein J8F10_27175 [Gemmata sp. G18]|uniref:Uncharacterized protein n=1 Tax=Gemmata palustris TaxID=2822762 RepID=A0ABS5BZ29_9BACT|nr:hypothetical protein [Gemmata palustris]MBP3958943.1 hypothetical protein [Gemmata palustris]
MRRVALRAGFVFVLGLGATAFPISAEDTKPTKDPPTTAPDWTGYVFVADVVGEVVKADDKSVTLRITWLEPQQKNGNKNNNRPKLSQNNRNFRNPLQGNTNRQNQVQLKEQHHDYELEYLPQSLVRSKTIPPKLDDKGKKVPHTQKEFDELRAPSGVTGYAANKLDLVPGTILEVYLIRDKSVSAAKATEDDLRIKYAVILGKAPNPPKDAANTGGAKPDDKKKKN